MFGGSTHGMPADLQLVASASDKAAIKRERDLTHAGPDSGCAGLAQSMHASNIVFAGSTSDMPADLQLAASASDTAVIKRERDLTHSGRDSGAAGLAHSKRASAIMLRGNNDGMPADLQLAQSEANQAAIQGEHDKTNANCTCHAGTGSGVGTHARLCHMLI